MLILFAGCRVGVGTDYGVYIGAFWRTAPGDWASTVDASQQEIGFTGLVYLVRTASDNPAYLFILASVLTVVPTYWAVLRYRVPIGAALVTYVLMAHYLFGFNTVRQGLAVAIVFLASTLLDSRWWRYALLVALAMTIHTSALPAGVVLWLTRRLRVTTKTVILTLLVTVPLALLLSTTVGEGFIGNLSPRYEEYLVDQRNAGGVAGIGTLLLAGARIGLLAFSLAIPTRDSVVRRAQFYLLLSVPLTLAGFVSVPVARMDAYFSIFAIVLIPLQLREHRKLGLRLAWPLIALGVIYYLVYLNYFGGLLPYVGALPVSGT